MQESLKRCWKLSEILIFLSEICRKPSLAGVFLVEIQRLGSKVDVGLSYTDPQVPILTKKYLLTWSKMLAPWAAPTRSTASSAAAGIRTGLGQRTPPPCSTIFQRPADLLPSSPPICLRSIDLPQTVLPTEDSKNKFINSGERCQLTIEDLKFVDDGAEGRVLEPIRDLNTT